MTEAAHIARSFPAKPLEVAKGLGHELWSWTGERYVDLGGASHGVANFGHNHPRIVAAIREQAGDLLHVTQTVPSPMRGEFLDRLHRLLPGHLTRTFLANSGTEAAEAALKHAITATGRSHVVAMRGSFHGRTLGALGLTHRPQYRKPFEGRLHEATFTPYNDVEALETAVTDATAAIVLEVVQGEGGLASATPEFLHAAQRIAHEHGALLVVDEVQTGLGRTGTDLAIEPSGIKPDLLLLGKSLAGGLPIGTCSMTEDVANRMPGGGHGNTFGGAPLVMAAGCAALDVLREERLASQAAASGQAFLDALRRIPSPLVREVRGKGLMCGLELRVKSQSILDGLLQRRRLALGAGPTVVRFLPPLAIPPSELDASAAIVADLLAETPTPNATEPRSHVEAAA